VIASGVNEELDRLRDVARNGKDILLDIQRRESENTGIPSLKISYNNVFGYYIEVRNTHKDKVPEGWIRKQTLVNAERYITEELKEYESQILGAEEKIYMLESQIYADLVALIQKIPVSGEGILQSRREGMLRCQTVSGAEHPAAEFAGQGGTEAQGIFQISAGVTAAVEIQDHTQSPLIQGQHPTAFKMVKPMPPDSHFFAVEKLHQLPDPALTLPYGFQIHPLGQRLQTLQLGPHKLRR
jgi:hypothetical protein